MEKFENQENKKLSEIKDVGIYYSGEYPLDKFLLVKVSDGKESKIALALGEGSHDSILNNMSEEINPAEETADALKISVLGGGKVTIHEDKKIIYVWGVSNSFGKEPDREETISLLKSEFPEYEIKSE